MAIQIRRGTDAEWESNKSNIVAGEPAIAMDTERVFVGTGTGTYVELANIDFVEKAMKEVEYSNFELQSVSGDIVSFPNGAGGIPVKDLQVSIEAVQSGSGDPSPTNIRPISGWDEVNVNVCGVNIWDEEWELGGLIWGTGEPTPAADRIRAKNYCDILPSTTYYAENDVSVFFYDLSKEFISYVQPSNSTFTTPNNAYYFKLIKLNTTTYNNDIFINYPSTDHDYHAYNGQTYTIDLNGTRYGGTLDVTTGVLTVAHKAEVDLGTLPWAYETTSNRNFFYHSIGSTAKSNGTFICSAYKFGGDKSDTQMASVETGVYSHGTYIYIKDTQYTDATTFKNSLTGQQLVYELATPQVVQLTPTQVRTLLGQNNIWADSGEVEVTYRISNVQ